jgi:hypothetical protein
MEDISISQPLLEACTPDLYNGNVFRITGLPVYASEKEIKRAAEKQKMLEELGVKEESIPTPYPLPSSPSPDAIKGAMNRLKMPESRLIDELFWFWPLDESREDSGYQAFLKGKTDDAYSHWWNQSTGARGGIAIHNIAVMFHLTAMDWSNYQLCEDVSVERTDKIQNYWKEAHERLQLLRQSDQFWTALKDRVIALNEPMLTSGFVRRIRETFQVAIASIHADFALRFLAKGKRKTATDHVAWLRVCCPKSEQREIVLNRTLSLHRNRVRQSVISMPDSVKSNPAEGAKIVAQAVQSLKEEREIFTLFYSDDQNRLGELFDPVISTCINGLVSFVRKTENNAEFVRLLQELQTLPSSDEIKERLNLNLEGGRSGLNKERLSSGYKILESIDTDEGHIAERLKRFKRDFMPLFSDFVEKEGSNSDSIKDLSDDAARTLRKISVDSYNKDKNFTLAAEAIRLAALLARDEKLRELVADDVKTVNEALKEATCHYCGKNASVPWLAKKVKMHFVTSRNMFGRAHMYKYLDIDVPKCKECNNGITIQHLVTWGVAILATTIATLLIPGGFIIWLGLSIILGYIVGDRFAGGNTRQSTNSYHRIQKLKHEGWEFGEKPR